MIGWVTVYGRRLVRDPMVDSLKGDWSVEGSATSYWSCYVVCRGRIVVMVNVSGPRTKKHQIDQQA